MHERVVQGERRTEAGGGFVDEAHPIAGLGEVVHGARVARLLGHGTLELADSGAFLRVSSSAADPRPEIDEEASRAGRPGLAESGREPRPNRRRPMSAALTSSCCSPGIVPRIAAARIRL